MELHDFEPGAAAFARDVVAGLTQDAKSLPCKYFYDERGSRLFEEICKLDEYYPTRTELDIMRGHAPAMADRLGRRCLLVEYGSGSSVKTRLLLDALREPAGYVPIDISREHLLRSANDLAAAYPDLEVLPVCADYTRDYEVPMPRRPVASRAVYFPGSTIGNFDREQARAFLRHVAEISSGGGRLLIGVDLKKDREVLERAYNDGSGVTAAFNLNLLGRINRELGGDFVLDDFEHDAIWNAKAGRMEMHLVSRTAQTVEVAGARIAFAAGERICTEYSYKYDVEEFGELAEGVGLRFEKAWTDPRRWFSVQLLRAL